MTTYQKNQELVLKNLDVKKALFFLLREKWLGQRGSNEVNPHISLWDYLFDGEFIGQDTYDNILDNDKEEIRNWYEEHADI